MAQLISYGKVTNVATYEFICNDMNDLNAIEKKNYNFGSVALVIHATDDNVKVFIADKDKNWVELKRAEG